MFREIVESGMFAVEIKKRTGTSLVVHCKGLFPPNAGGTGLFPGQGTRFHIPQLKDAACHNKN